MLIDVEQSSVDCIQDFELFSFGYSLNVAVVIDTVGLIHQNVSFSVVVSRINQGTDDRFFPY